MESGSTKFGSKSGILDKILLATRLTRGQNVSEATREIMNALTHGVSEAGVSGSGLSGDANEDHPRAAARPHRPLGETLELLRSFKPPATPDIPDMASRLRQDRGAFAPPPGAVYETLRYSGKTGARDYRLYVPGRPAARPALIVMLHGCAQSADDFALGTQMNAFAEELGFIVAYPEQTSQANNMGCWNWFSVADQTRGRGEAAIIAGVTRDVIAGQNVDPARVYVAGLSAGGAMAEVMSVAYPDLYAAAGVHSGLVYGAASDMASAFAAMSGKLTVKGVNARQRARTIVFHGGADMKVHPSNADVIVAHAREGLVGRIHDESENGVSGGRAFTRMRAVGADGVAQLEEWRVEGLGHAWSGGSRLGSHTDASGPSASREMVRFFFEAPGQPNGADAALAVEVL